MTDFHSTGLIAHEPTQWRLQFEDYELYLCAADESSRRQILAFE
jgi:hypothetical protein